MLNVEHFLTYVVRPALGALARVKADMNTPAAENLLVGTALQESDLTYLHQLGGGPALGVMQIEPTTHDDVWTNYLNYREPLADAVRALAAGGQPSSAQLTWNMGYAAAIARLVFWRAPAALPQADDIEALGQYWKDHYNTAGGAGTAAEWVHKYNQYAA